MHLKKRKGSSIVLVICVFAVLAVLSAVVAQYTTQNARAALVQHEKAQAYYLVMAGLEMGSNAVLQTGIAGAPGPEVHYILWLYEEDPDRGPIKEVITDVGNLLEDDYIEGKIEIRIDATSKDGMPLTSGDDVWVEIYVKSTVVRQSITTSYSGILRISTVNPANVVWDVENPLNYPEN